MRSTIFYVYAVVALATVPASADAQTPGVGKSIAKLKTSAKPLPDHYDGSTFLGRLPSGDYIVQSGLHLDTDGSVYCKQDLSGQKFTAPLPGQQDGELDANVVAYIVLPGHSSKIFAGVRVGDVALVLYEQKAVPAIVGDVGPPGQFGEASIETLRELGQERVNLKKLHRPYVSKSCATILSNGKEGYLENNDFENSAGPVTTIIFPGSNAQLDASNPAALKKSLNSVATARWDQLLAKS